MHCTIETRLCLLIRCDYKCALKSYNAISWSDFMINIYIYDIAGTWMC